jgi:hypothetical protein
LPDVSEGDALVNFAPVWSAEVGLDMGTGDDIDVVLGKVEGPEHGDECGPGVVILINAAAVVMELNDTLLVRRGHLVQDSTEPLEGALLPGESFESRALKCHLFFVQLSYRL